jgi:hypothetical protein
MDQTRSSGRTVFAFSQRGDFDMAEMKPREFYIQKNSDSNLALLFETSGVIARAENLIHVIEHSAYTAAIEERDRLKKYLSEPGEGNRYKKMLEDYDQLLADARALRAELVGHACSKWPSTCRVCTKLAAFDKKYGSGE